MTPKTKMQKQVMRLSENLSRISDAQRKWFTNHCYKTPSFNSKAGLVCGHCGEIIKEGTYCPNCRHSTYPLEGKKRTCKDKEYVGIVTTCHGFQVARYFIMETHYRKGEPLKAYLDEVLQVWIDEEANFEIIARKRTMSFYIDQWCLTEQMEIRSNRNLDIYQRVMGNSTYYPRQRFLDVYIKRGLTMIEEGDSITKYCKAIFKPQIETLVKSGCRRLSDYFVYSNHNVEKYWATIKVMRRNGYMPGDVSMYFDYINQLERFGKDILSPRYICPKDLRKEHQRYIDKEERLREEARYKDHVKKAEKEEKAFRKAKHKYLGISISKSGYDVSPIQSVRDFLDIGKRMKICIFSNEYYKEKDSLILTASKEGEIAEVVEYSLSKQKVVQSRGVCNVFTKHHKAIISLVNSEMCKVAK